MYMAQKKKKNNRNDVIIVVSGHGGQVQWPCCRVKAIVVPQSVRASLPPRRAAAAAAVDVDALLHRVRRRRCTRSRLTTPTLSVAFLYTHAFIYTENQEDRQRCITGAAVFY